MDIDYEIFTTNRDEGWIEVIRKGEKDERVASKEENCISITCTGWVNSSEFIETPCRKHYVHFFDLYEYFSFLSAILK